MDDYSQGQYSLNGDIQSGNVEGVEEDLCGDVAIMPRIEGCFCEQDWMLQDAYSVNARTACVTPR